MTISGTKTTKVEKLKMKPWWLGFAPKTCPHWF